MCDGGYQVGHAVKEAEAGSAVYATAQGTAAEAAAAWAVSSAALIMTTQHVNAPAEVITATLSS